MSFPQRGAIFHKGVSAMLDLKRFGQEQLLQFWTEISAESKKKLESQIDSIDFAYLNELAAELVLQKKNIELPKELLPPKVFPAIPDSPDLSKLYEEAVAHGKNLLRGGKVAVLTVAGGQGSRLGYDGPKGKFPISPIRNKPLFQYFAEKIKRASEKYSHKFLWFIMTSESNDAETRRFFEENNYFGLSQDTVIFFVQGMMPAIDYSGKIILEAKDSIALSPNGHGGTLLALAKSGALAKMRKNSVEFISYFQVDNPLVSPLDPLFIGLHSLEKSEMSSRSLSKTGPNEKLGNFCVSDGKLCIIEYSDMPSELTEKRRSDGRLLFEAGSPAIHVFSVAFIERLTQDGKLKLPWHRADKKVPFIDAAGNLVKPEKTNAVKLETFIFDALPFAENTLILEARREDEFSPVKNPDGVDSIVSCRRMMVEKDASMLEKVGVKIPRDAKSSPLCKVEISPLSFLDEEDLALKFRKSSCPILEAGKEYYFE